MNHKMYTQHPTSDIRHPISDIRIRFGFNQTSSAAVVPQPESHSLLSGLSLGRAKHRAQKSALNIKQQHRRIAGIRLAGSYTREREEDQLRVSLSVSLSNVCQMSDQDPMDIVYLFGNFQASFSFAAFVFQNHFTNVQNHKGLRPLLNAAEMSQRAGRVQFRPFLCVKEARCRRCCRSRRSLSRSTSISATPTPPRCLFRRASTFQQATSCRSRYSPSYRSTLIHSHRDPSWR